MQERKKKKKDPQLDSFIPSIWYRGICYVLMSFQSYFKLLWGCNLRGVVTDTQAQLGYIHHVRDVVTPSRKNFTERIINFPNSAQKPILLTFPRKKEDGGMFSGQRTSQWGSVSSPLALHQLRWDKRCFGTSSLSIHRAFPAISLYIQV